jgi:tripartite ATP-independent transporter DctP family solute receptor
MRRRLLNGLVASVAVPGLLLLAGAAANAAEFGKHAIKFAFQNQKGHPQAEGAQKFADLLKEKSGGQMTARLFPGGTLGGDVQTLSALQGGTVEMTVLNAGLLVGVDKDFGLVDLPFLFDTPQQADAVMDGPVGQALAAKLPAKGLVGLGYWELGFRNLTNNRRPVTKVDDIAGLKIRVVQSPLFIELFNTLGANAVPMPYPELYSAMETGTVDGQENPYSNILSAKFYEVQKHLTITKHVYNPQIVLVSGKLWDKLNADERKAIQDAATEARDYQRALSREQADKALAEIKGEGMQVVELSAEETAKFREKAKPVADKFAKEADPALVQQLYAEIEKARGKS